MPDLIWCCLQNPMRSTMAKPYREVQLPVTGPSFRLGVAGSCKSGHLPMVEQKKKLGSVTMSWVTSSVEGHKPGWWGWGVPGWRQAGKWCLLPSCSLSQQTLQLQREVRWAKINWFEELGVRNTCQLKPRGAPVRSCALVHCAGVDLAGKAEQVWVPSVNHRTSPDPSLSDGQLGSLPSRVSGPHPLTQGKHCFLHPAPSS